MTLPIAVSFGTPVRAGTTVISVRRAVGKEPTWAYAWRYREKATSACPGGRGAFTTPEFACRSGLTNVNFQVDTRYSPPAGSGPEWCAQTLREIRESRIGPVPITIELNADRGTVLGLLSSVTDVPATDAGCWEVKLEVAGELSAIACRDIAALTLHATPTIYSTTETS